MKKTLAFTLLMATLFSGCATWDGLQEDSSYAWEKTKEVTEEAWESTKEAVGAND